MFDVFSSERTQIFNSNTSEDYPPEETLELWMDHDSRNARSKTLIMDMVNCLIQNTNNHNKLSHLDNTLVCLTTGNCKEPGLDDQTIHQCRSDVCHNKCALNSSSSSCRLVCHQERYESRDVEKRAHQRRVSGFKGDRLFLGLRNKRYRLGLYDCISSYCGEKTGPERESCIINYCHREQIR